MKTIQLAAAAAALLGATGVSAQQANTSPWYAEVGYTRVNYEEPGVSATPGAMRLILGADVHPNLAVEAMVGFGVQDDTVRVSNIPVKVEVTSTSGFYFKPKFAIDKSAEVFARLGYARSSIKGSALGYSITESGSDFSYGVGMLYRFDEQVYGTFDYLRYYDKNGATAGGLTLAVGFRF